MGDRFRRLSLCLRARSEDQSFRYLALKFALPLLLLPEGVQKTNDAFGVRETV